MQERVRKDSEHAGFKVVGTRPIRPDGVDKVTGRARFGADYNLPGQLVGRVLRSPHPHARIKRIDASKAAKLPGVKAIVTRDDFRDQASEFVPAGEGSLVRFEHGGWTEKNVHDRRKFGDWPMLLDRFAALARS